MGTRKTVQTLAFACMTMAINSGARANTALEAEIQVSESGFITITHEQLVAKGINWGGIDPARLRVGRGSQTIAMSYQGPAAFGPGSTLSFFGESVAGSAYTRTSAYRIKIDSVGAVTLSLPRNGRGNCRQHTGAHDSFTHNPDRGYDITSAHTSAWYAARIARTSSQNVSHTETFSIANPVPGATDARIEVGLWGGINHSASPDHSVRLLLNGNEFARQRFDGLSYQTIAASVPSSTLRNGENQLVIEVLADTGLSSDLVYFDDIRIQYERELIATDNRVNFSGRQSVSSNGKCSGQSRCSKYLITGLTSPDIVVFRKQGNLAPAPLSDVTVSQESSGYQACFTVADTSEDRFWVEPASGKNAAGILAKGAVVDPISGPAADYLIVSHGNFISGLQPLAAARTAQGYNVRTVDVASIYDFYNQGIVDPDAIGAAISDAYTRLGTRFVLLVGGDTYDYFNNLGTDSRSFLPTYYLPNGTVVRHAPSDQPYADVDADGLSDVAIGRFPVRTAEELEKMVAKTLAYEMTAHSGKLLKVSDRSDGVPYESILSGLDGVLGPTTRTTNISLNNYANNSSGLEMARTSIASAVNSGHSMLAYFGHAQINSWAGGLLNPGHLNAGLFTNLDSPVVIWAMGCYGAYFTNPTGNSMAQALTLQSNGAGAVAMIGSTSLSFASSDIMWMNVLRPMLRNYPLGEALRLAQRSLSQLGPQYRDITVSGALLGDPALRLR